MKLFRRTPTNRCFSKDAISVVVLFDTYVTFDVWRKPQ